jgi:branched-chain amino acid aminotransferase
VIWINGEPHPAEGPHVSARDRGVMLADGVFETMRALGGEVFRVEQHLARLEHGLAVLGIPRVPHLAGWVDAAARSVGLPEAAIRVTVTRGAGAAGVTPPAALSPTTIVAAGPLPEFPASIYEEGLRTHVASGRFNDRAMTSGLKTIAYTDAIVAMLEARRHGADEALFLDSDSHCCEATSSNLFVWTGRTLKTPPLTCGVLPGITRGAVIELARELGLTVEEDAFGLDQLLVSPEVFLTSSLRGLAPVVRVGAVAIGSGTPGAMTHRLRDAYRALVVRECAQAQPARVDS